MTAYNSGCMHRMRTIGVLGAMAILVVVAGAVPSGARSDGGSGHSEVSKAVLPVWARGGFSGPRPRMPYAVGHSGRIAAIVYGYPLRSPPAQGRNNKILWVSRIWPKTPAPLWIRAQRMDGGRAIGAPVRHIVPGAPGPSIIDLPAAGCWRLTLTWSGRRDSLDLAYGVGN
jgi:hypothetical protein